MHTPKGKVYTNNLCVPCRYKIHTFMQCLLCSSSPAKYSLMSAESWPKTPIIHLCSSFSGPSYWPAVVSYRMPTITMVLSYPPLYTITHTSSMTQNNTRISEAMDTAKGELKFEPHKWIKTNSLVWLGKKFCSVYCVLSISIFLMKCIFLLLRFEIHLFYSFGEWN